MSQHWATIGEAGALSGLRIMVWVYRKFGRRAFNTVLGPVMLYYLMRRPLARKASRDYLKRVYHRYPDAFKRKPGLGTTYLHFFCFGRALLDKYLAWFEPPSDIPMDTQERELLFTVARSGKGCLMIGSHFGNLEYARCVAHRHPNLVTNILIHDKHAAKFAALFSNAAPQSRLHLIQVTELDIELSLRLKEKVNSGEWVLIAGDRVPVSAGPNVSSAEFFGERADFPIGPYVLARLLRCPVYLMHCFMLGDDYRLGFEFFADEIRPSRTSQGTSYAAEVQRYAYALEARVSKAPLQWFNFYDFWGKSAMKERAEDSREEALK
ncbi:MAG TPA: acyltransferase [Gammaproteobacteria bacterium]|nr:acyltransferase [Gammaproteobacteria bacterium]